MSAREIDDQYKRIGGNNSYRSQRFDGMRSMMDDYTGQRIFVDSTKHPATTAAQVDHIIPLHVVQEKYPDLSLSQQKYIANHPSNYAMTNAQLNMHVKNGKMNHQVVIEQAAEKSKLVVKKIASNDVSGAVQVSSEYAKTSTSMIKSEFKATTNMAVNSGKCRAENVAEKVRERMGIEGKENISVRTKISDVAAPSPEMELTSCLGNSAMKAVGGAVIGTTIVEAKNSIKENDSAETFVGNVVGRGTQAAISAGGGAVAGEIAGLIAIELGAGPIGWAITTAGAGMLVASEVSRKAEGIAESITYAVSDGVENLRLSSGLVDGACTITENIGLGVGLLWDKTLGSLFL